MVGSSADISVRQNIPVTFFDIQTSSNRLCAEAELVSYISKSAAAHPAQGTALAVADQSLQTVHGLHTRWLIVEAALIDAATNRGRETNAFKSLYEFLEILLECQITDQLKRNCLDNVHIKLARIANWDKPQWLKMEPATGQFELLWQKNGFTAIEMDRWSSWIEYARQPFQDLAAGAAVDKRILVLREYLHRRVSIDSLKNWLRRRPSEPFINDMFAALAQNKIYVDDPKMIVRNFRDANGFVRPVETRAGRLYFVGSDEELPVSRDRRGNFLTLPSDSDMVVFERRMIAGMQRIVPIAQPDKAAPNIQWFTNSAVKLGWEKERRFLLGPEFCSADELYGFFPEHYPMRITNSVDNRLPTEKTGAAIFGFARDHGGKQSRQLIVEYAQVMDDLQRTNSQLINQAREIFGLRKV